MNLRDFERLQENIENLVLELRKTRFKNVKLEKEIVELNKQIEIHSEKENVNQETQLSVLKKENERLVESNRKAKAKIKKLIAELEQKL